MQNSIQIFFFLRCTIIILNMMRFWIYLRVTYPQKCYNNIRVLLLYQIFLVITYYLFVKYCSECSELENILFYFNNKNHIKLLGKSYCHKFLTILFSFAVSIQFCRKVYFLPICLLYSFTIFTNYKKQFSIELKIHIKSCKFSFKKYVLTLTC